jgi:hypothetical protein
MTSTAATAAARRDDDIAQQQRRRVEKRERRQQQQDTNNNKKNLKPTVPNNKGLTQEVMTSSLIVTGSDAASRPKRIKAKKGRLRGQIMIMRRINCSV